VEVTGGGDGCRAGGGLAPTVTAAPIIEVRAWGCLEAATATTLAIEGFMGAMGDRRQMAGGRWAACRRGMRRSWALGGVGR
jgi:hypothetical protein